MKLTKLVSLILAFAIMLTLSSCNISDILDTPDDDQGDLGDEGNDNSNNNNGGNEEGVDLSQYSELLQGLLTNPEYDRLIERMELGEDGLAESPIMQPHPYAFLEDQGIDTSKIINGELGCYKMSYVIKNEPNNLYMYTRIKHSNYYQNFLVKYELTEDEMKDYHLLCSDIYIQNKFINNEISRTKDATIIGSSKVLISTTNDLDYDDRHTIILNPNETNKNCDVIFFGHLHKRKILIDEEKHSYILQGSSGCVKSDNTFYTLFDIIDNYGIDDNFNIYRVDVKYNRKKFVAKMQSAKLPGKEVFAPFCFGINFTNSTPIKENL